MGVNLILWDYIGTRGLLGKLGSDVEIPSRVFQTSVPPPVWLPPEMGDSQPIGAAQSNTGS